MSSPTSSVPGSARSVIRRRLQGLPMQRLLRQLAAVTAAGMFLVLIMGTLVTTTNSGHGCGNSWPLCHGQFVPQFAIDTAIEFSHRAVTGLESFLVFGLAIGVLVYWRQRLEMRWLAPLMVIFLLLQAALGAFAVIFNEPPALLALHFGVSLISFVSILLACILLFEFGKWDTLRDRPVPTGFRWAAFGLTFYTYIVVYLGAYVRHQKVDLACSDWPLCGGQVFPGFGGAVGIVFSHRIAALVLLGGTTWLFLWARRLRAGRPDLYRGSLIALLCVLAQSLEGALIVFTRVSNISALLHGAIVALLFGAMCYLSLHTLPRPRAARRAAKQQGAQSGTPTSQSPQPRAIATAPRA